MQRVLCLPVTGDEAELFMFEIEHDAWAAIAEPLPKGLWEIAELVEHYKIHAREIFGEPALAAATSLRLEPIDEVDDYVDPAAAGSGPTSIARRR